MSTVKPANPMSCACLAAIGSVNTICLVNPGIYVNPVIAVCEGSAGASGTAGLSCAVACVKGDDDCAVLVCKDSTGVSGMVNPVNPVIAAYEANTGAIGTVGFPCPAMWLGLMVVA